MLVLLVLALVQQGLTASIRADGCQIDLSDVSPQPIVVKTGDTSFLYPEPNAQSISLQTGDSIDVGCPSRSSSEVVTAVCVSGSQFEVDGKSVSFSSLKCSSNAFHTARFTNNSCENNGKEVEIGWIFTDEVFVRQMHLCFDQENQNTLYSHYHLTASIGAHESGVSRPSFIEDDFYNVGSNSVNSLYERNGQRSAINGLLGLSSSDTKYIQNSNDFFLSRGHLTAKADFVYANQQKATFHYINVAPQWQTFNGRNWNNVEMNVRDNAEAKGLNLEVYTGTWGVTTLPHAETGEDIELYLWVDGNERGIPVPELYWKIVHNPETKQGVAILGVNNPYKEDLTETLSICEDVSKEINWIDWDTDLTDGYIWACDVNDLKKTITYIPEMEVTELLV